jgi:acyl-homoserine-lactone acylase
MANQFPFRGRRRLLALASTAALALGLNAQAATVPAPTLSPGKVSIIRDRWGMAHLYAAREEDGFYGLGYATAEDRLEQVLLLYLQAKGELAARFGPGPIGADKVGSELGGAIDDAVASDRGALQWRIMDYARANLAKMQPAYRRDLEAYVAGMRRYMADHPEKRPAWAPEIEAAMPLAIFTQLIQEGPQLCPAKIAAADGPAKPGEAQGAKGSDAWVIGPTRTADRGVVFSSDSHGPWKAIGTLFYPWRMKAGGVDFQAYEPTGTAMFFFGNTPHFAWGWTEAPRYPGDCYRVATQPDDPRAYLFDGKLQHMEAVPYSIAVKGQAPVTGTFEYTRHNGVLSPVVERRGTTAYVASFAYAQDVGLEHRQLYDMAHARTRAELKAALQPMQMYPANLMIGGADGTLLYIRPGRVPKRPAGVELTLPIDGNSSRAAWQGFVSYEESVHLENPAQDYIANDNVSPDSMYPEPVFRAADYPQHFAFDPGQTTSREVRNIELLSAAHGVDDQGAVAIAMDE